MLYYCTCPPARAGQNIRRMLKSWVICRQDRVIGRINLTVLWSRWGHSVHTQCVCLCVWRRPFMFPWIVLFSRALNKPLLTGCKMQRFLSVAAACGCWITKAIRATLHFDFTSQEDKSSPRGSDGQYFVNWWLLFMDLGLPCGEAGVWPSSAARLRNAGKFPPCLNEPFFRIFSFSNPLPGKLVRTYSAAWHRHACTIMHYIIWNGPSC